MVESNTPPYNDYYDETQKYVKILFKPGVAVQARELTQLQTQLQKQIQRFGSHVFKEGSMVIPGESAIDIDYKFVKLQDQFGSIDIALANFAGKKVVGTTSGAVATVLETTAKTVADENTLFLKYESGNSSFSTVAATTSGSNVVSGLSIDPYKTIAIGAKVTGTGIPTGTYVKAIQSGSSLLLSNNATATGGSVTITFTTSDVFIDGETINTIEANPLSTVFSALAIDTDATGSGSRAVIKQGVYFAKGYFCYVEGQSLLLDKYSSTPSYKIGLRINDSFVTANDDVSLNDPATGSPNFNAPGADRLKISLDLDKVDLDADTPENFIELIIIKDGVIQKLVTRPVYSELEKTLARRTSDESGDYVVKQFPLQIKEHLDTGTNYGVYPAPDGDTTKAVACIEPGKAYVRGFEIETKATNFLNIDKGRDVASENARQAAFTLGNFIYVTKLNGTFNLSTYSTVDLTSVNKADGGYPGTTLGTAKVRSMEFVSGTPGTTTAIYKVWLFDIRMTGVYLFSAAKSIRLSSTVDADIVLDSDNKAILQNVTANTALLKLPVDALKTLKDSLGSIDTAYQVKRYFSGTMSGNTITITAGTNELFEGFNNINYHMAVITASGTATGNGFNAGSVVNLSGGGNSATLGGSPTGKQITFTIPSIAGSTVSIIATVSKTAIQEKTKTLTARSQTIAHASTITLDKADIFDIVSITDAVTSAVITDRYVLDNGQRDNFYGVGKLTFKSNYPAPSGNVVISYRYFAHGNGDFFSVDSYSGVVTYDQIPTYTSPETGAVYNLRNFIDFRPRVNDANNGFSVYSEIATDGSIFSTDYSYYLPRIDKVILDSFGNFRVIKGISAKNPNAPTDPSDAMVLFQINVPAYTFNANEIVYNIVDNKRYTMRDIGKLDKRLQTLEYYTSLNLLEKSTAELFIDDGFGSNRFKNGFLVDNFASHVIGDVRLPEYSCSIDTQNGILRPSFTSDNIGLDFYQGFDHQITGDLITLPYTTTSFISQPLGSKIENVNPYNVFAWVGSIKLTPETDEWYETQQAPDRIINSDDGLANSLASLNGQVIWNDWQTSWIGQPISVVNLGTTKTREDRRSTGISHNEGWIRDTVATNQLVSAQVGQTRTGTRLSVAAVTNNQSLGDRVVDTQIIPFIRPKNIVFSAKSLKPNTRVYPFFDNVAVSAYTKPTGGAYGDALIANNSGEVSGEFALPNNASVKFRTGERVFKLTDSDTNNTIFTTTSGVAPYIARGVLETKENTILSTRSAQIVSTTVSDSRTIVGTDLRTTTQQSGWYDPLAQTFLVEKEGGVFISSLKLNFATKDQTGIPVTVQIRNVVNGYPGAFILPFSTVTLNPSSVNTSGDGSEQTTFTFESPVYLEDKTEYCFVVLSNSNQYNLWCSRIGDFDFITGQRISQQPYAGVMFKSQNASTWSADQEQDIKFELSRCVFDTSVTADITFRNAAVEAKTLGLDPFYTTNSSTLVRVTHKSHGLLDGDETTISGVSGTQNNIPAAELNGLHTITFVDFDNYTITVTTNANKTGATGGGSVKAMGNIRADVINPIFETLNFPQTSIDFGIKLRDTAGNLHADYVPVISKANTEFTDERLILGGTNEPAGKSAIVNITMYTDNDSVSPVVDLQRTSLVAVSNRINNVTTNELLPTSGDAIARYITKKITLATPANAARVYLAAVRPTLANVKVYIKYQPDSDKTTLFDNLAYVEVPAISYPAGDELNFKDYVFELNGLEPYSIFAIKIVMTSGETSDIPLIKDFRCLALGT